MDTTKYYNHINDETIKKTIKHFVDSLIVVDKKGINYNTDFFNPKEIEYATDILNVNNQINYNITGGYENAERRIIAMGQYMDEYTSIDYIDMYKITNYGDDVTHRDILGAVLNLGIDRKKVGDIAIYEKYALIVVKKTVSEFIKLNLTKIKKNNIELEKINLCENMNIEIPKEIIQESFISVSSMRLDSVVSAMLNISRSKSVNIISKGYVKLNHEKIIKNSEVIEEYFLISIRGYGRYRIKEIIGKSKKGRQKIIYGKIE